jgi:hypothetical protein
MASGVISIAVAGEDLPLGEVLIPGWLKLINLDAANFVTFGPKLGGTYHPMGRLLATHEQRFMLDAAVIPSTTTFHLKADTAAVLIQYYLFSR